MATLDENRKRVMVFVQELLRDEDDRSAITPALIAEKMKMVLAMKPGWGEGLDRDAVTDEMIRRFSLWIGQDATLKSDEGHEAWLTAARKRDWRYWQRYRQWLERELSWKAADGIDRSVDAILELLEDPVRTGTWTRRGLVVGHVQSGKTANYVGLICKAADAGYKIVIVLAGLHNNLRSQTQMRLEEGFLGYETYATRDTGHVVGVGEIDSDREIHPNCATTRSNNGDFSTRIARNLAVSPEQRPWLFVVKKNKTVLRELLKWVQNHAADTKLPGAEADTGPNNDLPRVRKVVTKLPLLMIDDEADHASVDTQELLTDAEGNPDDEHQPTTINRLIRRILHSFARSAYVGYTATPFANIFIHERAETRDEGPDLFPAAFIINLAAPSNYIGPTRVFGLPTPDGRSGGLPLVREVIDHESADGFDGWMPQRHRNGHLPRHEGADTLPPSLIRAIDTFVLACAARAVRGQAGAHSSMLVHVTRFTSVQTEVFRQVQEYLRHLRQRIQRRLDDRQTLTRLRTLWETDFLPTDAAVRGILPGQVPSRASTWEEILTVLPDTVSDIEVKTINGTAKDVLDYAERAGTGLKVIAIGGDKLARGLTLEGLCVSYFLRASRMYDTLMQMGRWFGYRPGYLDVCRLYTTAELTEWFGHIADAAEELREEFDLMAASGGTPKEYGLKVQSHPVLMVTSRLKMRTARNLMLSFSGQLVETVSLFREAAELSNNLMAVTRLIGSMGKPGEIGPVRIRNDRTDKWPGGYLWSGVPAAEIMSFLQSYRTHPAAYKVNSAMLAEFIRSMARAGELTQWTVALVGLASGDEYVFTPDVKTYMNKRTGNKAVHDRYSIGRLLDPKDEAIDLDQAQWMAALNLTRMVRRSDPGRAQDSRDPEIPNGPAIRAIRGFGAASIPAHPERGLLLLYALDPKKAEIDFAPGSPPVIAFGISFGGSDSGLKVEYKVNNVLWEREYGPAD